MDQLTARPQMLKQANLCSIRKIIRRSGTATRAEIAEETRISSTTVRSLLGELLENGEIESIGYDASSGGRKAERYQFRPERYHGAVFCMSDGQLHALIVNLCGVIVQTTRLEATEETYEQTIMSFLDALVLEKDLRAIGLGVPGVVEGGSYWKRKPGEATLRRLDLGEILAKRYGLPVVMENDLNAVAIGFWRCYENKLSGESPERASMAYLYLGKDCVSAGFLTEGHVIRGFNNFAGELGLLPANGGQSLDVQFAAVTEDTPYIQAVTQMLRWICGILNPKYIALGGAGLRRHCVGKIRQLLSERLPKPMAAQILCSDDIWQDYYSGMAYLTAGKIFDEIQLVKE